MSTGITGQYRTAQDKVTRSGVAPVLAVLSAVTPGVPLSDRAWAQLLELLLPDVLGARKVSRDLAVEVYAATSPSGTAPPIEVKEYDVAALAATLAPIREKLSDPSSHTQAVVGGASRVARHVEAAGRDYMRQASFADDNAIGWARVARGARTCAWCLMLISRGPAYHDGASAGVNDDGTMNAWHTRCDCQAVPVFDLDDFPGRDQWLAAEKLWNATTGEVDGVEKVREFRRAVEGTHPLRADGDTRDRPIDAPLDDAPALVAQGDLLTRRPADLTDDEMDDALAAAIEADDWDRFGELEAEAEVRQEAKDRKVAASAARSERRRAQKERDRAAQLDLMVELIDQGVSESDAYAQAYGVSVDQAERTFAIESLRSAGYKGSSFEKLARDSYADHCAREWLRAEGDCRGEMRNQLGERMNVDDRALFSGPVSRVKKYASEELLQWFEENGRTSFDEWVAQLLGNTSAAQAARKAGEVSRDR